MIAIVVAILTWGWGSTLATTGTVAADGAIAASTVGGMTVSTTTAASVTSYTALGATLNAGFTTLATQTSVSLINNKGDIGQTLKDLGSSDSVKQLVAAMLTGGVGGYYSGTFNLESLLAKTAAGCAAGELTGSGCQQRAAVAGTMAGLAGPPMP
ncbi:MAG: DUF637 domain-containing protein [Betaproteobacteria bacterium]|nr:DUF637 domain-containing protein [Betaproteobacteria bacterium]